jgi:hypothetical protein
MKQCRAEHVRLECAGNNATPSSGWLYVTSCIPFDLLLLSGRVLAATFLHRSGCRRLLAAIFFSGMVRVSASQSILLMVMASDGMDNARLFLWSVSIIRIDGTYREKEIDENVCM